MKQNVIIACTVVILLAVGVFVSGLLNSEYDHIIGVSFTSQYGNGILQEENFKQITKYLKYESSYTQELNPPEQQTETKLVPNLTLQIKLTEDNSITRNIYDIKDEKRIVISDGKLAYTVGYDDKNLTALFDIPAFHSLATEINHNLTLTLKNSDLICVPNQTTITNYSMGVTTTESSNDDNAKAFLSFSKPNPKVELIMDEPGKTTMTVKALNEAENEVIEVINNTFSPLNIAGTTLYKINVILEQHDIFSTRQIINDYILEVDLDVPAIAAINATEQPSGGVFMIHCKYIAPLDTITLEQDILEDTPEFYRIGNEAYVMIPLDYWSVSGDYHIKVSLDGVSGKHTLLDTQVKITDRDYAMQNLIIDSSTSDTTRTDDAYAEYHEKFMPVRLKSDQEQYWEGEFIVPVEGRITTDYGARRTVNDELTSYRHNGIDYGAPEGAEIHASNTGKIVFAEKLLLTGNTVMIDHGLGLFSYYLHCSEIDVKAGDMVKKGDVIAKVGSTGFSTGAHLHFTTSYHLSNIDPLNLYKWDGNWPE